MFLFFLFFFFKQKTAYEMRISDWSSDVCSSDLLSESAIRRAAETVKLVAQGHGGEIALAPPRTNARLYTDENPLELVPFARKVALCQQIDAAARARDPRVAQVSVGLSGSWQAIAIVRPAGDRKRVASGKSVSGRGV